MNENRFCFVLIELELNLYSTADIFNSFNILFFFSIFFL